MAAIGCNTRKRQAWQEIQGCWTGAEVVFLRPNQPVEDAHVKRGTLAGVAAMLALPDLIYVL